MRPAVRVACVVLVALALLPAIVSGCPLCKDAKSDTEYPGGTASLGSGFYYSILLMVSAPFVVVGGLALRIYLSHRRRSALSAAESAERQPVSGLLPDPRGARS